MLPLKDDNPKHITPYVTYAIIAACVGAFLWQVSLPPDQARRAVIALGAVPAVIFNSVEMPPELAILPARFQHLSLITSMFLHLGWWHLFGNMLYMWIFADNVEDAMGHDRFVAFYLLCGLAATIAQSLADPASMSPVAGASGAISGVLGAYLLLYPRAKVLVWAFAVFVFKLPAWMVLGAWIAIQVFSATMGGQSNVAWWAHIGGAAAGMALVVLFKRPGVGLWGDGRL
ncbi:MAG: rhomboid family intramembrane serine protease, partial [Rhodospirillales bacterium]